MLGTFSVHLANKNELISHLKFFFVTPFMCQFMTEKNLWHFRDIITILTKVRVWKITSLLFSSFQMARKILIWSKCLWFFFLMLHGNWKIINRKNYSIRYLYQFVSFTLYLFVCWVHFKTKFDTLNYKLNKFDAYKAMWMKKVC